MTVSKNVAPQSAPVGIHRVERVLVYAAISVAVLGAVCIAIILIAASVGKGNSGSGIWPTIAVLPELAFPIAILLIIAYVVVSSVRRTRESRSTTR